MKLPSIISFFILFFLLILISFSPDFGWIYFYIGGAMVTIFTIYLNFQRYGAARWYWVQTIILSLGTISINSIPRGDTFRIVFPIISTILLWYSFYLFENFFNGKKYTEFKVHSQALHYVTLLYLFMGAYGLLFYRFTGNRDRLISNDMLYWLDMLSVSIGVYFLSQSFLRFTLPEVRPKKNRIKLYSFILAFLTFELFWLVYFLSFRYIQAAVLVFMLYFIIMEYIRSRFDKSIEKKQLIINITLTVIGIIVLLITSKWRY